MYEVQNKIHLIKQKVNGLPLHEWAKNPVRNPELYEMQLIRVLYQVLQAVAYLHSQNIVHAKLNTYTIFIEKFNTQDILVNILSFDKAE